MTPERFEQLRFKHKTGASWNRVLTAEIKECLDEIQKMMAVVEAAKLQVQEDFKDYIKTNFDPGMSLRFAIEALEKE